MAPRRRGKLPAGSGTTGVPAASRVSARLAISARMAGSTDGAPPAPARRLTVTPTQLTVHHHPCAHAVRHRHIDEIADPVPPLSRAEPDVRERAGRPGILDVHRQPGALRQAAADLHVAPA